jgi:hypothetical protein
MVYLSLFIRQCDDTLRLGRFVPLTAGRAWDYLRSR